MLFYVLQVEAKRSSKAWNNLSSFDERLALFLSTHAFIRLGVQYFTAMHFFSPHSAAAGALLVRHVQSESLFKDTVKINLISHPEENVSIKTCALLIFDERVWLWSVRVCAPATFSFLVIQITKRPKIESRRCAHVDWINLITSLLIFDSNFALGLSHDPPLLTIRAICMKLKRGGDGGGGGWLLPAWWHLIVRLLSLDQSWKLLFSILALCVCASAFLLCDALLVALTPNMGMSVVKAAHFPPARRERMARSIPCPANQSSHANWATFRSWMPHYVHQVKAFKFTVTV